jgi:hypothetical protein
MEKEKRLRGRPRKAKDTIQFWQFARAARVMYAYDKAREKGEKHSAAIRDAVQFVKERSPELHISETEVKRILAAWRPRNAATILRFEQSVLTEEKIKKFRWIRERVAMLQEKMSVPPNDDLGPSFAAFTIRFAQRPNFLRSNRKIR